MRSSDEQLRRPHLHPTQAISRLFSNPWRTVDDLLSTDVSKTPRRIPNTSRSRSREDRTRNFRTIRSAVGVYALSLVVLGKSEISWQVA